MDSRLGEGSTFWAELPVEPAASPGRAARARSAGVEPRVVVVTLGSATADSLREGLAARGFRPVAPDGADAPGAHWIADAAAIEALGRRPTGSGRVLALARFGEPGAAAILRAGWADALLTWPIVQTEWRRALDALADGTDFVGHRPATGATTLPRFPAARVLVADDSAVNREVARAALARCGITAVTQVEDGQAAVEACRTAGFDLVLMDGSMPVLDGYAAAAAIRAEEAARGAAPCPSSP